MEVSPRSSLASCKRKETCLVILCDLGGGEDDVLSLSELESLLCDFSSSCLRFLEMSDGLSTISVSLRELFKKLFAKVNELSGNELIQ